MGVTAPKIMFLVEGIFRMHTHYYITQHKFSRVFSFHVGDHRVFQQKLKMSRVMRKPAYWFPTWSVSNQAVQLQKIARGLEFWI